MAFLIMQDQFGSRWPVVTSSYSSGDLPKDMQLVTSNTNYTELLLAHTDTAGGGCDCLRPALSSICHGL